MIRGYDPTAPSLDQINTVDGEGNRDGAFVPKRYAHSDGLYWGSPETCDALAPGFYMPAHLNGLGPALRRTQTVTDNLLRLPDPTCDMLLNEFVLFWERSGEMVKRGLTAKRGLLLYGPPGSGKTSAVQIMSHHMIREMNGVVIFIDHPPTAAAALPVDIPDCLDPIRLIMLATPPSCRALTAHLPPPASRRPRHRPPDPSRAPRRCRAPRRSSGSAPAPPSARRPAGP